MVTETSIMIKRIYTDFNSINNSQRKANIVLCIMDIHVDAAPQ